MTDEKESSPPKPQEGKKGKSKGNNRDGKNSSPPKPQDGKKGESKGNNRDGKNSSPPKPQDGKKGESKGNNRDGKKSRPKRDFFEEFRDFETHQLEDRLNDNKSSLRSLVSNLESMENERKSLIATVQVLRNALYNSGGLSKERRELIRELKAKSVQINEIKAVRDDINQRVAPPLSLIERLLNRTWKKLTTIGEDPSRVPNLPNEIQKFSFFFELKEMHRLKSQSDAAHSQFVELIRAQKETIKKLDELKDESSSIADEASKENPRLAGATVSRKEEKSLNDRIEQMLSSIRSKRKELNNLKRENGKLEAFLRIRKDDEKRGRKVRKRINSLRQHAADGGALSMEDMARILESGGLAQLQGATTPSKNQKKQKGRGGRGGRRRTAARRGTARSHQRRED